MSKKLVYKKLQNLIQFEREKRRKNTEFDKLIARVWGEAWGRSFFSVVERVPIQAAAGKVSDAELIRERQSKYLWIFLGLDRQSR